MATQAHYGLGLILNKLSIVVLSPEALLGNSNGLGPYLVGLVCIWEPRRGVQISSSLCLAIKDRKAKKKKKPVGGPYIAPDHEVQIFFSFCGMSRL